MSTWSSNTPLGRGARGDGYEIRRLATTQGPGAMHHHAVRGDGGGAGDGASLEGRPEAAPGAAPRAARRRARVGVKEPVAVSIGSTFAAGSYAVVELDGDLEVGPPGTFAMVRDPDGAAFLPRPFGLFRRAVTGRPRSWSTRRTGSGALARAATLEVLTPLGRGFDLAGADAATTLAVGGGIGTTVFFGLPGCARRVQCGSRPGSGRRAAGGGARPDRAGRLARGRDRAAARDRAGRLAGVERVLASGPAAMVRAVAAMAAAAGVPARSRWRRRWRAASAPATAVR